jgi:ribonuclease HI
MMWTPLHVGVKANEQADQLAGDAVENGIEIKTIFSWKPLK